jgi:hypothetical protein
LYLAGAGIGTLEVDATIAADCRTINSEVEVVVSREGDAGSSPAFRAGLLEGGSYHWVPLRSDDGLDEAGLVTFDPVSSGASAARWILARILSAGSAK